MNLVFKNLHPTGYGYQVSLRMAASQVLCYWFQAFPLMLNGGLTESHNTARQYLRLYCSVYSCFQMEMQIGGNPAPLHHLGQKGSISIAVLGLLTASFPTCRPSGLRVNLGTQNQ